VINRIKLDWRRTFQEFSEAHGGNPVESDSLPGKQLFMDGWTYSNSSYRGPAAPPPVDAKELAALQRIYWHERREIVLQQIDLTKKLLDELRTLQESHSLPLMVKGKRVWDSRRRRWRRLKSKPLDLQEIIGRLEWLVDDEAECKMRLDDLRLE
jgi:hypothetical protein